MIKVLQKGANVLSENLTYALRGIQVTAAEGKTPEQRTINNVYQAMKKKDEKDPTLKDTVVTGIDAIRMAYMDEKGNYDTQAMINDGLATGALIAAGMIGLKTTQVGTSLLTGNY